MKNLIEKIKAKYKLKKIRNIRSLRDNINRQTDIGVIRNLFRRYPDFVFMDEQHMAIFCECKRSRFIISSVRSIYTANDKLTDYRKANNLIYTINIQNIK